MKYYFIGDDKTQDCQLFHKAWIEDGYAYTSGDEKYGNSLKKLKKDDVLFCYVGKIGVVAIGKVIAEWDGVGRRVVPMYKGRLEQGKVYKIQVNWYRDLTTSPIPHKKLSGCGSFSVRQTLQEIKNKNTATNILALVAPYHDIS